MAEEKKEGGDAWGKAAIYGGAVILIFSAAYLTFQHLITVTSAITLSIGVLGAISLLTYFFGLGLYLARMGQEYRIEGIHIMQIAIQIIFVVVCLGGIVRLLQYLA